jgi:hypothetical protein
VEEARQLAVAQDGKAPRRADISYSIIMSFTNAAALGLLVLVMVLGAENIRESWRNKLAHRPLIESFADKLLLTAESKSEIHRLT